MSLREKIISDLKTAMKEGDTAKRDVLRLLDSAIKNTEIEKRKKDQGLSDEEILEVLSRAVKQRNDSIEQFEKGGRPELAEKEKAEIVVISAYLPEQLGRDEVVASVKEIVAGMGQLGPSDFGRVMGQAMGKLKGKADGKVVKEAVKEILEGIK